MHFAPKQMHFLKKVVHCRKHDVHFWQCISFPDSAQLLESAQRKSKMH